MCLLKTYPSGSGIQGRVGPDGAVKSGNHRDVRQARIEAFGVYPGKPRERIPYFLGDLIYVRPTSVGVWNQESPSRIEGFPVGEKKVFGRLLTLATLHRTTYGR